MYLFICVTSWKHSEKENILYQHFVGVLGNRLDRRHTLHWESLGLSRLDDQALGRPFTQEELKHTMHERQKRHQY
jgi:hypothetical protein